MTGRCQFTASFAIRAPNGKDSLARAIVLCAQEWGGWVRFSGYLGVSKQVLWGLAHGRNKRIPIGRVQRFEMAVHLIADRAATAWGRARVLQSQRHHDKAREWSDEALRCWNLSNELRRLLLAALQRPGKWANWWDPDAYAPPSALLSGEAPTETILSHDALLERYQPRSPDEEQRWHIERATAWIRKADRPQSSPQADEAWLKDRYEAVAHVHALSKHGSVMLRVPAREAEQLRQCSGRVLLCDESEDDRLVFVV